MVNVEEKIGSETLTIETGKIARQSAGSVVLTYGNTVFKYPFPFHESLASKLVSNDMVNFDGGYFSFNIFKYISKSFVIICLQQKYPPCGA